MSLLTAVSTPPLTGQGAALLAPGAARSVRQPIVRVRDGSVLGWESLARFGGEDTGTPTIFPLDAFDLADREGLRVELELACVEAALRDGQAPDGALLFLNISPKLLLDHGPRRAPLPGLHQDRPEPRGRGARRSWAAGPRGRKARQSA